MTETRSVDAADKSRAVQPSVGVAAPAPAPAVGPDRVAGRAMPGLARPHGSPRRAVPESGAVVGAVVAALRRAGAPKPTVDSVVQLIRRRIDPRLPPGNGLTAADYREFNRTNVKSEFDRVTLSDYADLMPAGATKAILTGLGQALQAALQAWEGGAGSEAAVVQAMGAFVDGINVGADAIEQDKRRQFDSHFEVRNAQPTAEDNLRWERQRREGIMVPAGDTHVRPIRGFHSAAEAQATIQGMLTALQNAGLRDAQVAARGSAVRGTSRDSTRPYRPGTSMDDKANDSSDIDFFFFSPILEAIVNKMAALGHPSWRMGGNIHPDDLVKILNHKDCVKAPEKAGIDRQALLTQIANFPVTTKQALGRKSDVTLLQLSELQKFQPNEYVLL